MSAAMTSGLNIVGDVFHQFEPQDVTGTVLLAESRRAIHTWTEDGFVTVGVYVYNYVQDNRQKGTQAMQLFETTLQTCARELCPAPPRGLKHD